MAEAISNIGHARSGIEYYLGNSTYLGEDPNYKFLEGALVQLSQAAKAIESQQRCVKAARGGGRRTRRKRGKHVRR